MEGLLLDPNQSAFASEVVELYRENDPRGCAVSASSINLNCAAVRNHFCDAARHVSRLEGAGGRKVAAVNVWNTAVREFGCTPDM